MFVISAGWYVARENDAIGSSGDTCLIKLVVRELERAVGSESKPRRDQPGLVEHVESTRPLRTYERDIYNYVPLTARGREKPWREWRRYLFFKRGEIDELSLSRTFFFRNDFREEIIRVYESRASVNDVTFSR